MFQTRVERAIHSANHTIRFIILLFVIYSQPGQGSEMNCASWLQQATPLHCNPQVTQLLGNMQVAKQAAHQADIDQTREISAPWLVSGMPAKNRISNSCQ